MSFGVWIEDERLFAIEKELDNSIFNDDVELFVSTIRKLEGDESLLRGQEFLMKACQYKSLKCAYALLNGVTPLILDVNRPTPVGAFPIHLAAFSCNPSMIELLLHHGARTDVRCGGATPELPLHVALDMTSRGSGTFQWFPGNSVYKLVALLCLQNHQYMLESVELLAWNTKEVEREFLRYASEGKLSFLASLLVVARDKLSAPIREIYDYLDHGSSHPLIPEDKKRGIFLLLDVFMKAGAAIEAYIKKNKDGVPVEEISESVASLLRGAGHFLGSTETDLNSLSSFHSKMWREMYLKNPLPVVEDKDIGMEHYQTSGRRWMTHNRPGGRCEPYKLPRRYEISEEQKRKLPTFVDKPIPVPIPYHIDHDYTASQFIDVFKTKGQADGISPGWGYGWPDDFKEKFYVPLVPEHKYAGYKPLVIPRNKPSGVEVLNSTVREHNYAPYGASKKKMNRSYKPLVIHKNKPSGVEVLNTTGSSSGLELLAEYWFGDSAAVPEEVQGAAVV